MSLAQQTARWNWIDAQIRAGRYPNAQLVRDYFQVSLRTAYDDRNSLLIDFHAPLEFDRLRNGWYYTDPTFKLPFMALPEVEASALRRLLLTAQEYLEPTDAWLVELLFTRLAPDFPQESTSGLPPESVGGALHLSHAASAAPELLTACRQAIGNRQKLDIVYYSAHRNETSRRVIYPYHLHNFQGEQHLIAWCEWRQDIRQFFLGRVRTYELLPEEGAFARQAVDVEAYLRQGLGVQHGEEPQRVRVRFSAYQARWMRERQAHPSQQIEDLPDGGLILTLWVAGRAEVARWILAYGGEAEALEPEELRQEVAAQAKKMASIYSR